MYFSYLIGPPPTPVRASRAAGGGSNTCYITGHDRIVYYIATVRYAFIIRNKWVFNHKRLIIDLHWETKEQKQQN